MGEGRMNAGRIALTNQYAISNSQLSFVTTLIQTGSRSLATEAAGYGSQTSTQAVNTLSSPAVMHALRMETSRKLLQYAPAALNVLLSIMKDKTAPKGVRVDAAKAVLDRSGFIAPRQGAQQGETKSLNEMTTADLRSFISAGESELAGRAKDVSAPEALVVHMQVSDLLD